MIRATTSVLRFGVVVLIGAFVINCHKSPVTPAEVREQEASRLRDELTRANRHSVSVAALKNRAPADWMVIYATADECRTLDDAVLIRRWIELGFRQVSCGPRESYTNGGLVIDLLHGGGGGIDIDAMREEQAGAASHETEPPPKKTVAPTPREARRAYAAEGVRKVVGVSLDKYSTSGSDDEILVVKTQGGCFDSQIEAPVLGYDTPDNNTDTNPTPAASLGFVTVTCEGAGGSHLSKKVSDVVRSQNWAETNAREKSLQRQLHGGAP